MSQLPITIDLRLRKRAMSMYLSGYDIIEISEKLELDIAVLRDAAFGTDGTATDRKCWESVKKNLPSGSILSYISSDESKVDFLTRGAACCADIMVQTLGRYQKMANNPEMPALSPKELASVAKVYKVLDDTIKLETGKPTRITESVKLTFEQQIEISKIVGEDQLITEADYEDITPDEAK